MKNKLISILNVLCSGFVLLSGCSNSSDQTAKNENVKKDYDIFIYNSDVNIGNSFRSMCDEYTQRTGVVIRTVTPSEEKNTFENFESYLDSDHPPDIFTVNNLEELDKLKSKSEVWDFGNATEETFKDVVNNIPEILRLSSNTSDSFGIPYTTEGYGFIVDPKMISSLFGGEKYRTVQNDLQECTYEEFNSMVEALKMYINNNQVYQFNLNGKEYSFSKTKGELSENLTGVFSFAGGEPKYSGNYLANIALSAVFKSAAEAHIANESVVAELSGPFIRFAQLLDSISSNVAGQLGNISRGAEMISNSQNSLNQSMKNFVNGKSVFLLGGTEDYKNLSIYNSLVAKRCIFIPIKMPFAENEVITSDITAKNIHRSIPVYCPKYYCINAKSSDKSKKAAQDFLTWMQTSELAQKYIISEFGFTPYDIKESSVIENALSRSMVEYLSEELVLPAVYFGAPSGWGEQVFGKYVIDQFLNKSVWTEDSYSKISEYAIKKWNDLKNS